MSELWAITGASGYVGRELWESLGRAGFDLRGLSRSGGPGTVAGDVRDLEAVRPFVREADVVVHLAAYVHRAVNDSVAEEACRSVNVGGTRALIEAVASENPAAFVILVSSASVYGPSEENIDERALCKPHTIYGESKREAEDLFLAAVAAGRVRGCVVRPAMIFGPGAPGNLRRLVRMVRTGVAVEISSGSQRKSLVPVDYFVAAIRAIAAHRDSCDGGVFNIAGEALTIHEILMSLASAQKRTLRIVRLPAGPVFTGARAADFVLKRFPGRFPSLTNLVETYSTSSVLDDSKLRRMTGFVAPRSVREALSDLATV